jgi:dTMP kinase
MKRPIPKGLLVVIEGIDGAGKTSIATLLAQWCGERGLACNISKEPTGLKWGQELRLSAKEGRLTLERELELFILDRKDHITRSIQPALDEGSVVILDRYYWSTAAYQGARGADVAQILATHAQFAPTPDLWLVLDLDVDAGLGRVRSRGDQPNEFETKSALTKSRAIFHELVASSPQNSVLIDSAGYLKESLRTALNAFKRTAIAKVAAAGDAVSKENQETIREYFGPLP